MQPSMNPNPNYHPMGQLLVPPTPAIDPHMSVDDAIRILEQDASDKGLQALTRIKRAQEDIRKRKYKRVGFWIVFVTLMLTLFFAGKAFLAENVVESVHVTTNECTVPWGTGKLDVVRHYEYPSKSLLGYQLLDRSHPKIIDEIKLPGDTLTILGADNRITEKHPKGKFWRMNFSKGEFGSRKLKYADQLWLVGEKDKTTLLTRNSFCK